MSQSFIQIGIDLGTTNSEVAVFANGKVEIVKNIYQDSFTPSVFGIDKSGISRHIENIFETKELDPMATVAKIATVQKEGSRQIERKIDYYNLDVILSVGYRVNS